MPILDSASIVAAKRRQEAEKTRETARRRLADELANRAVDFQERDDFASAEELNAGMLAHGSAALAQELAAGERARVQELRRGRRRG